MNKNE